MDGPRALATSNTAYFASNNLTSLSNYICPIAVTGSNQVTGWALYGSNAVTNCNVGVGTSPSAALHVLTNPASNNGVGLYVQRTGTGDVGLAFSQSGVSAFGIIHNSNAGLSFIGNRFPYPGGAYGAGTEYMRIASNGLVGIGTTNPAYTLDVSGNAHISGQLTLDSPMFVYNGSAVAPAIGTYGGAGDRLILWPGSSTTYPFSLGIASSTLWSSVPASCQFQWFNGGTSVATLTNSALTSAVTVWANNGINVSNGAVVSGTLQALSNIVVSTGPSAISGLTANGSAFSVSTSCSLTSGGLFQGGTWNATYNSLSPGTFSLASTGYGWWYQRMGNIVNAVGSIVMTTTSSTTNPIWRVSGLPINQNSYYILTGVASAPITGTLGCLSTLTALPSQFSMVMNGTYSAGSYTLNFSVTYAC